MIVLLPLRRLTGFLNTTLPCTSTIINVPFSFFGDPIFNWIELVNGFGETLIVAAVATPLFFISIAVATLPFADDMDVTTASCVFSQIEVHEEVSRLTFT